MLIQNWIHRLEGSGLRYIKIGLWLFALGILMANYNLRGFKNMSNPEAMDAAQVARNIADGKGYTTLFIRPLSMHLFEKAYEEEHGPTRPGDKSDPTRIRGMHPDLANPPVYPMLLAGLMKIWPGAEYQVCGSSKIFNTGGRFKIYGPDFEINLLNQLLFLGAVVILYFLTRRLFDPAMAWTSALLCLGTDLFWRFSISGLSTMLLMVIFLGLAWTLTRLEEGFRKNEWSEGRLISWGALAGLLTGLACLTRYSFGWLIIPVLIYFVLYLGGHRGILCFAALAAFLLVIGPWVARNYHLSNTFFGTAGYSIYETASAFPGNHMQRSLDPDFGRFLNRELWFKFVNNVEALIQEDLPKLGGSWITAFFLVGLLLGFKNPALGRLRNFLLFSLVILAIAQALGRTEASTDSPIINADNLLVVVAPLVLVFGVGFFYSLVDHLNIPIPQLRSMLVGAFCFVICLPAIFALIGPSVTTIAYPPYFPPAIQRTCTWMKEDELMMSDVPWAIAWYGERQCVWLTLDTEKQFFKIYDYYKPVHALYLTPVTMDSRFLSEWVRASEHSWGSFALQCMLKPPNLPAYFPLTKSPIGFLPEQLFLSDTERWGKDKSVRTTP